MDDNVKKEFLQTLVNSANDTVFRLTVENEALTAEAESVASDVPTADSIKRQIDANQQLIDRQNVRINTFQGMIDKLTA